MRGGQERCAQREPPRGQGGQGKPRGTSPAASNRKGKTPGERELVFGDIAVTGRRRRRQKQRRGRRRRITPRGAAEEKEEKYSSRKYPVKEKSGILPRKNFRLFRHEQDEIHNRGTEFLLTFDRHGGGEGPSGLATTGPASGHTLLIVKYTKQNTHKKQCPRTMSGARKINFISCFQSTCLNLNNPLRDRRIKYCGSCR